jgi:hypothetical protein
MMVPKLAATILDGNFRFKNGFVSGKRFQCKRLSTAGFDNKARVSLPPCKKAEQQIQYGTYANQRDENIENYI